MDPTTDARTTQRRERKSSSYMQRSWTELKDCSLWLRNLIARRKVCTEGRPAISRPSEAHTDGFSIPYVTPSNHSTPPTPSTT
jgi:hypothetical protein